MKTKVFIFDYIYIYTRNKKEKRMGTEKDNKMTTETKTLIGCFWVVFIVAAWAGIINNTLLLFPDYKFGKMKT